MLNKNKKLSFFPFKKVSLTFKITLWYTTFIVLLIGSLLIGIFFVRDSVVESGSKKKLIQGVRISLLHLKMVLHYLYMIKMVILSRDLFLEILKLMILVLELFLSIKM